MHEIFIENHTKITVSLVVDVISTYVMRSTLLQALAAVGDDAGPSAVMTTQLPRLS